MVQVILDMECISIYDIFQWREPDKKLFDSSLQNSRTPGTLVHGGSNLTIGRVTAGLEFNRPIRPKWSGTGGLYFQVF